MDLIKREDAIRAIGEHLSFDASLENRYEHYDHFRDIARHILQNVPSAEKQGEWIDMGDFEQCSVCKGTHLKEFQSYYGKATWIKTPFCPNCGARMKGADDE